MSETDRALGFLSVMERLSRADLGGGVPNTSDQPTQAALYSHLMTSVDSLLTQVHPLTPNAIAYVIDAWPWFSAQQSEAGKTAITPKKRQGEPAVSREMVQVEQGWKVMDEGDRLSTACGEYYGTQATGRLLKTVRYMIALLAKRGAKQITCAGSLPARRLAGCLCEQYGIRVVMPLSGSKTAEEADWAWKRRIDSLLQPNKTN